MVEREAVIEKVEGWLEKLGFNYAKEQVDSEGGGKEPVLYIRFRGKAKQPDFDVYIIARGDWILCRARLATADQIPKAKRAEFYRALLNAVFRYSEVSFSADDDGNIFVECDIHRTSDLRTFEEEFKSLPVGMGIFAEELAPKFGIKLGKG